LSTYPILIGSPQSDAESNQNKLAFFIFESVLDRDVYVEN
jgi:hypothetical protein